MTNVLAVDPVAVGNPLIVRLPDDERPWAGWKAWSL